MSLYNLSMNRCALSHWSALVFWKAPFIREYFGSIGMYSGRTDVTVFSRSHYYLRKNLRVHLCSSKLPPSVLRVVDGQSVVSPEFAFLQLAGKLDPLNLILLGIMLCSSPTGSAPFTTRQNLIDTVSKARRHYGRQKALRALHYVREGCRSIQEAFLFLFLTLPHRLGGCGFRGGVFNHKIRLNEEGARALGQAYCHADLYFPQHRLIVEYDSFLHHRTAAAQGKDAERSIVLERQPRRRYQVIHVHTSQLYNRTAFHQLFLRIAATIGKRVRIRAVRYKQMFQKLRQMLPRWRTPAAAPT